VIILRMTFLFYKYILLKLPQKLSVQPPNSPPLQPPCATSPRPTHPLAPQKTPFYHQTRRPSPPPLPRTPSPLHPLSPAPSISPAHPLLPPLPTRPYLSPYSIIFVTTPAPTVRPPSRIAKRRPSSIAMGTIRDISKFTLSPGITISEPSGRVTIPVTSVVLK